MQWDRLFEDLEGQLASEWEAERQALDAESERLRVSRLDLRTRLRPLCGRGTEAVLQLSNGRRLSLRLRTLGADWVIAESPEASEARITRSSLIIPLHAILMLSVDHGALLSSLDDDVVSPSPLRERMTFGFVLRDLARRRVPVDLSILEGEDLHGTIDRAAADHLDLAVHDAGEARRADAVRGFRILPFTAIASARLSWSQLR